MVESLCGQYPCERICSRVEHCPAGQDRVSWLWFLRQGYRGPQRPHLPYPAGFEPGRSWASPHCKTRHYTSQGGQVQMVDLDTGEISRARHNFDVFKSPEAGHKRRVYPLKPEPYHRPSPPGVDPITGEIKETKRRLHRAKNRVLNIVFPPDPIKEDNRLGQEYYAIRNWHLNFIPRKPLRGKGLLILLTILALFTIQAVISYTHNPHYEPTRAEVGQTYECNWWEEHH